MAGYTWTGHFAELETLLFLRETPFLLIPYYLFCTIHTPRSFKIVDYEVLLRYIQNMAF